MSSALYKKDSLADRNIFRFFLSKSKVSNKTLIQKACKARKFPKNPQKIKWKLLVKDFFFKLQAFSQQSYKKKLLCVYNKHSIMPLKPSLLNTNNSYFEYSHMQFCWWKRFLVRVLLKDFGTFYWSQVLCEETSRLNLASSRNQQFNLESKLVD